MALVVACDHPSATSNSIVFVATAFITFVTVNVYVVVDVGEMVIGVPLVTIMFPGVMTPVPPEK
jgi:hypothetical protein